jgi:hypothetical protein
MEHDPREPTGDLGYDMAHEVTGERSRSQDGAARSAPADDGRDDAAGDYAYDEAHDFRR